MSHKTYPFNKLEYTAFMSAEPSGPWANAWCANWKEYDRARQLRAEQRSAMANSVRFDASFADSGTDYGNA
jgi:hypothetical protein